MVNVDIVCVYVPRASVPLLATVTAWLAKALLTPDVSDPWLIVIPPVKLLATEAPANRCRSW